MARMNNKKVYVGNLPPDIRTRDLEDLFYKYGKINNIDIKTGRGPPFGFIEFDDERDAEDAVKSRDGYNYDGYALRVEITRGGRDAGRGAPRGGSGGGFRGAAPSRRSEFRVSVTGLPVTGSWQDLKDHMREAGDVGYADVFRDGTGVVEFLRYEDMKYAIKKFDESKFKSHEGDVSYIRVFEEGSGGGGGGGSGRRGRSPARSRSGSPDNARAGGRAKGGAGGRASPSYSPMRSRSRSREYRR